MIESACEIERTLEVPAAPEQAYALVAALEDSLGHFPGIARIQLADGVYTWDMVRKGVGKVSVGASYGLRYTLDPERLAIRWEPVPGVGNGEVSGSWELSAQGGGTRMVFRNRCLLRFPLARVLRRLVDPLVQRENAGLIEGYLANLRVTLCGGDGRLRRGAWIER